MQDGKKEDEVNAHDELNGDWQKAAAPPARRRGVMSAANMLKKAKGILKGKKELVATKFDRATAAPRVAAYAVAKALYLAQKALARNASLAPVTPAPRLERLQQQVYARVDREHE